MTRTAGNFLSFSILVILVSCQLYEVEGKAMDCINRGYNCTLCLSDGQCGFCDSCDDHCHQDNMHTWENCTGCAHCIPGTLTGPTKGYVCRREWYYYEKCPEVVSEKKTVHVGIALYLMNLHSVDMKAGTFNTDFYLYFKVPRGQTLYTKQKCKNDGMNGACFDLVNAAGSVEVSLHEGKYFRVKGKFNFAADLDNFPFDNQTLKIEIQDMEMTAKDLRWKLLEDSTGPAFKFKSGISPTLNYTGWVFDSYSWSQIVYERYNPFLDEGVSRYAFRFHMSRPRRAAFYKIFLPPLFIVVVICFAFALPPSDATMRVWIDGNLLVSCVMFHSTMSEHSPNTQKATMADMFLLGVYGFIFVSFMVSIILLKLQRKRMFEVAETFYRYAEWMVWFTAPTYFVLLYYIRISLYYTLIIIIILALGVAGSIKACTMFRPKWFLYENYKREANSPEDFDGNMESPIKSTTRQRMKGYGKANHHELVKLKRKNLADDDELDFHDIEIDKIQEKKRGFIDRNT